MLFFRTTWFGKSVSKLRNLFKNPKITKKSATYCLVVSNVLNSLRPLTLIFPIRVWKRYFSTTWKHKRFSSDVWIWDPKSLTLLPFPISVFPYLFLLFLWKPKTYCIFVNKSLFQTKNIWSRFANSFTTTRTAATTSRLVHYWLLRFDKLLPATREADGRNK